MTHLSLKCRLLQNEEHTPCSGTCDCHFDNPQPCECKCHTFLPIQRIGGHFESSDGINFYFISDV